MLSQSNITPLTPYILRFYAKCFVFPYDEMIYELQYMFRQIERSVIDEEEIQYVEQILNIINQLQGEDFKDVREDFALIFSNTGQPEALCPMYAEEFLQRFARHYDSELLSDLIEDYGLPVNPDEPVDSVVNILEIMSLLVEDRADSGNDLAELFFDNHLFNWLPDFCHTLFRAGNISFYRELAGGLREYLMWLAD